MSDNIIGMPAENLINEGISQKNRIIMEVMQNLFDKLPEKSSDKTDFILSSGIECIIKKFYEPQLSKMRGDFEEPVFGFDVKFKSGALNHIEFSVISTGWERRYDEPIPVDLPLSLTQDTDDE